MLAQPCYHCSLDALLHSESSCCGTPAHLLFVLSVGVSSFASVLRINGQYGPDHLRCRIPQRGPRLQRYHSVAFTIISEATHLYSPSDVASQSLFFSLWAHESRALFISRADALSHDGKHLRGQGE
ncbi:hypothetical protein BDW68DRAFT_13779 [Aspergillus falconensis]